MKLLFPAFGFYYCAISHSFTTDSITHFYGYNAPKLRGKQPPKLILLPSIQNMYTQKKIEESKPNRDK